MPNTNEKEGTVVDGRVVEALPNTMFRVELADGSIILTYLAGRMRLHRIKVLIGDKVQILLDPYGGKGRVVKRL
jgi:translation initiation factor IF-1